jgi:hypothetical protein
MEKTATLKCRCCGNEKDISWGRSFFVSREGKEEFYNINCVEDNEAKAMGIAGFWVDKICKNCGESLRESRYIEDTTNDYTVAWMNFPKVDIIERCHACGSKDVLTLYEVITGDCAKVPCPSCREGKLEIVSIR